MDPKGRGRPRLNLTPEEQQERAQKQTARTRAQARMRTELTKRYPDEADALYKQYVEEEMAALGVSA